MYADNDSSKGDIIKILCGMKDHGTGENKSDNRPGSAGNPVYHTAMLRVSVSGEVHGSGRSEISKADGSGDEF